MTRAGGWCGAHPPGQRVGGDPAAGMVLLSAQSMDVAAIAKVAFTSEDRVRDVIRNFEMLMGSAPCTRSTKAATRRSSPWASGARSRRSPRPSQPSMTCRFPPGAWPSWRSSWWLKGVVDDISHEGLRVLLREEGVTFQRLKTWKASKDPRYAAKKARVEHLYAIADREVAPEAGEPGWTLGVDESGPLNLQPRPGRHWAAIGGKGKEPGRPPRPRLRATYTRTAGVRHLLAAYELGEDKLYGHIKPRKTRAQISGNRSALFVGSGLVCGELVGDGPGVAGHGGRGVVDLVDEQGQGAGDAGGAGPLEFDGDPVRGVGDGPG